MLYAILSNIILVLATVMIHFEIFRLTSSLLPKCNIPQRGLVLIVVANVFIAHIISILLYALVYYGLISIVEVGGLSGETSSSFMELLYYSTTMYTSLGIGDIIPYGHLRLISSIEALNGLVLIAWSASFTFLAMRRFWSFNC